MTVLLTQNLFHVNANIRDQVISNIGMFEKFYELR